MTSNNRRQSNRSNGYVEICWLILYHRDWISPLIENMQFKNILFWRQKKKEKSQTVFKNFSALHTLFYVRERPKIESHSWNSPACTHQKGNANSPDDSRKKNPLLLKGQILRNVIVDRWCWGAEDNLCWPSSTDNLL